ncbi:MAG: GerMN domain-containing protein [Ignavibacteriales bacterium]
MTEGRQVSDDPAAVINSLLAGPASRELYTPFPKGTRLLGASLSGGVLRLDFSEEFEHYVGNNDAKMSHAIREAAFQIPGVTAVEILVEGKPPKKGPHVEFDRRLEKGGPSTVQGAPESDNQESAHYNPESDGRDTGAPAQPPMRWQLTNPAP